MNDTGTSKGATDFSSAGPTNDFRIKPEVCGPGENLGVASWAGDEPSATDRYRASSGTSFASPAVAGGVALLQQLHKRMFNSYMDGAAVKALLCHTADDISNWEGQDLTGPDVKTGYGAINLEKAAQLIEKDKKETLTIHSFELDQGETETLYFQTTAVGELLTATLSWYDPPALFYTTNSLVNDLDLRITQKNKTYLPWALSTNVQQPVAILGDNTRDNLEKVVVSEALGGRYKITISHKGTLRRYNKDGEYENSKQKGALIVTGPGIFSKSEEELDQFSSVNNFLVAPMPASDNFTVSALNNSIPFRDLRIFGLDGNEILFKKRENFSLVSCSINISMLPIGIYILGIETKLKTMFKKIIIK